MATTAMDGGETGREVSFERVFSRTFGTIRANPFGTLGIAFVFSALPTLLFDYLSQDFRSPQAWIVGGDRVFVATIVAGLALWLALSSLTQGALVRATIAHSEGRASSLTDSMIAGLRAFVPLMALSVMAILVVVLGFVALIVPGIIFYCMFAVAPPALVAEGIGPVAAMGRSRHLTSGARWKVFAITLAVGIGTSALSAAINEVTLQIVGGIEAVARETTAGRLPLAYFAVEAIGQTLTSCVWCVLASALYIELRDWKDGPRSEALAEVFA